jgi:hypothetical protein
LQDSADKKVRLFLCKQCLNQQKTGFIGMLKTLEKTREDQIPSQTRLMAEYMLQSYKERIEKIAIQPQTEKKEPQNHTHFVTSRQIKWLQKKLKEKAQLAALLKNELSATAHIAQAEEHLRKKLETENTRLKTHNDFFKIARDEETTILTMAMNKYRTEKNRYCRELQIANHRIASLEFDMQDKKKCLAEVSHELMQAKERICAEQLIRKNRDARISALEKEKEILLSARTEETQAVKKLLREKKDHTAAYSGMITKYKEKVHYLELELGNQEKIIALFDKERRATNAARDEEKEALLAYLRTYRTEQKKQKETIQRMKSQMYQTGKNIGQLTQSL